MNNTTRFLDDEHMQLYEWKGAGVCAWRHRAIPPRARRDHPWQGTLALLSALLTLGGCDADGPVQAADEQVAQAVAQMHEESRLEVLTTERAFWQLQGQRERR